MASGMFATRSTSRLFSSARDGRGTGGSRAGIRGPTWSLGLAGRPQLLSSFEEGDEVTDGAVQVPGMTERELAVDLVDVATAVTQPRQVPGLLEVADDLRDRSLGDPDAYRDVSEALPGQVTIGGESAQSADFLDAVWGNFPLVAALIALLTFILLARAFRSLVLPLKAVLLNLLSVAAAWGLLVLVFQEGWGSEALWGIEATRAINVELPIVIFAFLFGISMDYQVFIISWMREAYDRTPSTEAAVVEGIGRTGRLVTSAALILGFAFAAFAMQPGTEAKMFALALGGGILIDATIIRGVLAPAFVAILGRWNWWLPDWAARLLRVEPSRAEPEAPSLPAATEVA